MNANVYKDLANTFATYGECLMVLSDQLKDSFEQYQGIPLTDRQVRGITYFQKYIAAVQEATKEFNISALTNLLEEMKTNA